MAMDVPLQDVSNASEPLSIKNYKVNAIERHCLPPPMKPEKLAGAVDFLRVRHILAPWQRVR